MKNNIPLVLLSILIFVFMGIGFAFKQPSNSLETNTPNKKLTVWIEDPNSERDSYFTYMSQRFTSKNPDIYVDIRFIPGSTQKAYNFITTEVLNKNSPDIILTSLENYNRLACDHQLYPLTHYIKGYDPHYFISSAISSARYNDDLYGIGYHLDPEVLVYRKDFLDSLGFPPPSTLGSVEELANYLSPLDDIYRKDKLSKTAFSIPTLISGASFYSSLLNDAALTENTQAISSLSRELLAKPLHLIHDMYHTYDIVSYHSSKISAHPFFNGQAALALEPLSLVYSHISKDKNLLRKIGIVPIHNSPLKLSYSNSKYISVFHQTTALEESMTFLDFFFSEGEVWNRYMTMNLPITVQPLKSNFIQDSRFHNEQIIDYIEAAFHHGISLDMPLFLKSLDEIYEQTLHK